MSNLESIYDVLVSWLTEFEFIDTVAVGINVEGTMILSVTCANNITIVHKIAKEEMEVIKGCFGDMERRILNHIERQYKLATVGEE